MLSVRARITLSPGKRLRPPNGLENQRYFRFCLGKASAMNKLEVGTR